MTMRGISSIGRSLDLRYPTNRAIAVVTLVVMVGGALWKGLSGTAWGTSILWGIQAGLAVFLTWAVGRELDPDHPLAAFAAVSLILPVIYLWELPRLSVILWLVILMRAINRTAGPAAGLLDAVGFLGLGGWLAFQGSWGYGVLTALAFLLDSQLPNGIRRHLTFAVLAVIVTVIAAVLGADSVGPGGLSLTGGLIALALSLLFLPVLLSYPPLESVGDQTGELLIPIRVQAAQGLALLAGIQAALLGGRTAVTALSPLWAATLGATIIRFHNRLLP